MEVSQKNAVTQKQDKKALAEKIWLHYYNEYLFSQGIITEQERNRMKNAINTHATAIKG